MTAARFRFAFLQRLIYPDPSAAALQTARMAGALAELGEAHLFVPDVRVPDPELRAAYGLAPDRPRIWSMKADRWPRFLFDHSVARRAAFNGLVGAALRLHPRWRRTPAVRDALFVRSRSEILFWGGPGRRLLPRRFVAVAEVHDLPDPEDPGKSPALARDQTRRLLEALGRYDHVIAVTRALADDCRASSDGAVDPVTIPLSTGLDRPRAPSAPSMSQEEFVIGYVGTVDEAHGVDELVEAAGFLSDRFVIRLVGHQPEPLAASSPEPVAGARIETRPRVPYAEIAAEIDGCDVVVVPAGASRHSRRYRSPLKVFDYLRRGAVIVAADVPAHREVLRADVDAVFYPRGDPRALGDVLNALATDPGRRERLARAAWERGASLSYEARAERIGALLEGRTEKGGRPT